MNSTVTQNGKGIITLAINDDLDIDTVHKLGEDVLKIASDIELRSPKLKLGLIINYLNAGEVLNEECFHFTLNIYKSLNELVVAFVLPKDSPIYNEENMNQILAAEKEMKSKIFYDSDSANEWIQNEIK